MKLPEEAWKALATAAIWLGVGIAMFSGNIDGGDIFATAAFATIFLWLFG